MTPQRRAIASVLQAQERHLSAEEILRLARRQHPRLSLATVYRTLRRLTAAGLVRELRLNGDRRCYAIERGQGQQHLVCLGCGRVIPFACGHCLDVHADLAERYGFRITGARVELLGYCARCRTRSQDEIKETT